MNKKSLFPVLVGSVRLSALTAGAALVLTGECQISFVAVFVIFFLLGLGIEKMERLSRLIQFAQPYLAGFAFMIAVTDLIFLSKSFLLSAAHFLLVLQGLRLLVLKTPRENLGGILIASLMVLSASTLAIDWTFFLMLLIFLPMLIWTLLVSTMAFEEKLSAVSHEAGHVLAQLRWPAAAAAIITLVCCSLVFVVFPRFNFRGFRGHFLQPVHKAGFVNQVDPGAASKIFADDSVVMRVEVAPRDRKLWTGYLRGDVLEEFDGRRWRKFAAPVERLFQLGHGRMNLPVRHVFNAKLLHQNIYLESMDSGLLFCVPYPHQIRIDRAFLEISPDGVVQRGWSDGWRVHYEVDSEPGPIVPEIMLTTSSPYKTNYKGNGDLPHLARTRHLPVESFHDIASLTRDVVGPEKAPMGKAQRIEKYLHTNFSYTLDGDMVPSGQDPIHQFLFVTKRGHCEYFASAMGVMLRTLDIPSRLATGFYSQEWNNRGQYYVVRMRDAHTWVEAYIKPYGWVSFDPTPRSHDAEGVSGWGGLGEIWDFLNLRWNRYILSYDMERQVSVFRSITHGSSQVSLQLGDGFRNWLKLWGWDHFGGPKKSGIPTAGFLGKGIALFFVLLSLGLVATGAWVSKRRGARGRIWFYRPLIRLLEKNGLTKSPAQTLWEFAHSQRERIGDDLSIIDELAQDYYRLRFDPRATLTPAQSQHIREKLKFLTAQRSSSASSPLKRI